MNETKDMGFEEAMERLEAVSSRLSEENVPLDEALSLYEQGVGYYTMCKNKLEDASRRIQVIENSIESEE